MRGVTSKAVQTSSNTPMPTMEPSGISELRYSLLHGGSELEHLDGCVEQKECDSESSQDAAGPEPSAGRGGCGHEVSS